ncbi:SMEK domain-containing protein [Pseudomonas sp. SWRI50]|uniref:SMEK domain-containing protein n=1 Tax=Pseudomonas sp. SWRI50 TaxID=2745484 RepID=UPI0016485A2C|nr:SMEK domain-containing protein [Pseudomonas sp. SWRI50]MBC3487157.1 SMEK domain-containing protein [Pseudomonas sp. SWRI50]
MLADRGHNLELISSTLISYTCYVSFQAQRNLLDEAKGTENALLRIASITYNRNFTNLNHIQENFPAIDWLEANDNIGVQVTTTRTWNKITSTIDKLIANNISTSKEVWFLFISNDIYSPRENSYLGHTIKAISIPELLRDISLLSNEAITLIKNEALSNLSAWFPASSQKPSSSYIHTNYQTPLGEPSNFITHHNLWNSLGDPKIIGNIVFMQIQDFTAHYSQLPLIARTIIAKTIQHASQPGWLSWQIEINIQELELYLSAEELSNMDSIIALLESKSLAQIIEKNPRYVEYGEDTYIFRDKYLVLNWRISEPDYDIFTALKSFYSAHLDQRKLFQAFEFANFIDIT